MLWVLLHACFSFEILTTTLVLILSYRCFRAACSLHIKLDKGKWELLFHQSFSHGVQKAQSHGQERQFGAKTSRIPFLLNMISYMAISQGHSPCVNSPPSKIRHKKKKFCLLTGSCEICEVLGRHLILVGLMVFRKYIHVHTLHNLK